MFFLYVIRLSTKVSIFSVALYKLRRNIRINFDLWICARIIHYEIIETLIQHHAQPKKQFQGNADFSIFQIAYMRRCTWAFVCQLLLRHMTALPCFLYALSDKSTVKESLIFSSAGIALSPPKSPIFLHMILYQATSLFWIIPQFTLWVHTSVSA